MPPVRRGRGGGNDKKKVSRTFEEYYSDTYGKRWPALRKAMLEEPRKVALYNRCCQLPFNEVTAGLERVDADTLSQVFQPEGVAATLAEGKRPTNHSIMKPSVDEFNIRGYYLLDYTSALIVENLKVGAFDKVLDMCASHGSKSVAITQFLSPDGELVANEASGDRCARLRRNLLDHIPPNFVPWSVTQRKGETWYCPSTYSRVLVDAPCSSERHVLLQSRGNTVPPRAWSESALTEHARTQQSLLQRAIETCVEGGRIVYSTCSISPVENDDVVREVLRRTRCGVEVVLPDPPMRLGEATEHGWMLMPDTAEGWGPLYLCIINKTSERKQQDVTSDEDSSSSEEEKE